MKISVILLLLLSALISVGGDFTPLDSLKKEKAVKASNLKVMTRFHSMGQFSYGGRIVSPNPTLDFNLNYDRKNWGLQIFKAIDLRDRNTQINFTLAVVNKNFRLGKRLSVTTSAGFILEQSRTIADHGSDVVLVVSTIYRLSKVFTLDYTTLFGNLVLEPDARDWVNRFRLQYSKKHIDVMLTGWHNNKVFDTAEYITCGVSAFYSRVKISNTVSMNAGATLLIIPYSNDTEVYPKRNGLIFTLGMVID